MAIRWKNFSTSNSLKTTLAVIFALSVALTVAAYSFIELDVNSKYAIEALYEEDYVDSIKHKNEVVDLLKAIMAVTGSDGEEAKNGEKTLEHTEYLFLYEGIQGKNPIKEYNHNNENLSISTYPCLYEWNSEEGLKLGSDTNSMVLDVGLNMPSGIKSVKIACPREVLKRKRLEWLNLHNKVFKMSVLMSIGGSLAILSLIWSLSVAGTGYRARRRIVNEKNGLYIEIPIALGVLAVWYWAFGDARIWKGVGEKEGKIIEFEQSVSAVMNGVIAGICALLLLYSILSVVGRLRNRMFLQTSFSYKILRKSWGQLSGILTGEAFYKSGLAKREWNRLSATLLLLFAAALTLVITVVYQFIPLVVLSMLAIFVSLLLYGWGTYKRICDYARVDKQINDIYTGNYNTESDLMETSPYYETSKKMSSIGDGIQRTLEEKIKSERMKIELVTNVSHDLKTPLTSIISYVDLLAREEGLSGEARDYVTVLMKKSARLKEIVSDVFELAKTTSGEVKIEVDRIDFHKLIVQTIADMEDKIRAMGLTIRLNVPDGPVYVKSDGKRLYRVLQNLIDNTLKYSLKGTRIYVDLSVEGKYAVIVIKNTANYEMTFTKEDILERFFRADKARTTEGSGLGISIAHAFVVACGGEMDVDIDGDMFKVIIRFARRQSEVE